MGLYRLGTGCSYSTVLDVFNVGKETARAAAIQFVQLVRKVFYCRVVQYPTKDDVEGWAFIEHSFSSKHGLTGAVGAIDGTHIPIKKPINDKWNAYINRKGYSSIAFQAIVDGAGNFRDVCGGAPGSLHDSRLFSLSDVRSRFEASAVFPDRSYLIGDSGYAVSRYIMPPFSGTSEDEVNFNFLHSSTRIVVERAFGMLKGRFCILLTPQEATPEFARDVTFCCMALHNLLNNRSSSVYMQEWDKRTAAEAVFSELVPLSPDDQPSDDSCPSIDRIREGAQWMIDTRLELARRLRRQPLNQ